MEENTPTTCVYFKIDKNMRLILMCLVFGASITQYLRVNTPITNQKSITNYINSAKPSLLTNPHALALVQTNPYVQFFFNIQPRWYHPCGRVMFENGR
jgi:hypothetical protein